MSSLCAVILKLTFVAIKIFLRNRFVKYLSNIICACYFLFPLDRMAATYIWKLFLFLWFIQEGEII